MSKIIVGFALILACVAWAFAQRSKSTLLIGKEAERLADQCSRPSPKDFTGTWEPSKDQIVGMESRFIEISKLKVASCCIVGRRIEKPDDWYMQYAALIWKGKKIIYVSAVSTDQPEYKEIDSKTGSVLADWRTRAVEICDGGNSWGVIYDVAARRFSELAVNGIG